MFRREGLAPLHEGADCGGRRVEHRHAVAGAKLPEPVPFRPVGCALVHHDGGTVGQRSVNHVGMTGHPPDVGRAPEDIVLPQVKDVSHRRSGLGEIAAGRVDDALRLPGCPRGIEDEQQILRLHGLGGTTRLRLIEQAMPPVVPTFLHFGERFVSRGAGPALDYDDVANRGTLGDRLVGEALERKHAAPAIPAVRRDESHRLGVVDPVSQRLRRRSRQRPRSGPRRYGRRPAWRSRPRGSSADRSLPGRPVSPPAP